MAQDGTAVPPSVVTRAPAPRKGWRRWLAYLLPVGLFLAGLVVSPLALLLDLGRFGRRLDKVWVLSYLVVCLFASSVAWGGRQLLMKQARETVAIVTDYSLVSSSLDDVPYAELITLYSVKNNLDPALVAAVVKKESQFRVYAVSPAGARGLMQIHPPTWRYLCPDSPCRGDHPPPACGPDCIFDPEANVRVGCSYLRRLLDEFSGDVILAFAAYNAGSGAVHRYSDGTDGVGLPPFAETRGFIRDVLGHWFSLKRLSVPLLSLDPSRLALLEESDRLAPLFLLGLWGLLFLWLLLKMPRAD
ncbi:MAG: lytic transglycosylase domain-containing protein [Acetobacteraceae bacterium]|nr:lytic transglycosylase domain-containing protein [Acetobacteraceae bacterium]